MVKAWRRLSPVERRFGYRNVRAWERVESSSRWSAIDRLALALDVIENAPLELVLDRREGLTVRMVRGERGEQTNASWLVQTDFYK